MSSFIKRVYAEIERNDDPSPNNIKQDQNKDTNISPGESSAKELTYPDGYVRKRMHKKSMSTTEAIAELKMLCKEYDPCLIYTDMVKIGEG